MKKLNKLLLVCFVLVATTNFAQVTKFGIRAGVGIPNLKSTDDNIYSKDYESVPGFDGSFFGDFGITENFSIKAELGFSRKGGERNGTQPVPIDQLGPLSALLPAGQAVWATFDNTAVFNYIEIPVLAKYEWNLGDSWGVYVNGGFYVDFIINPEQVTSGTSSFYYDEGMTMPVQVPYDTGAGVIMVDLPPQDLTATTDINNQLANMDFGAMFGVGLTKAISENSELLLDIRGSYGFIPLQNDTEVYGSVHMGNMTFALGYAYTLPKKVKVEEVIIVD